MVNIHKKARPVTPEGYRTAVVSEAIVRHNSEFERCYDTYLAVNPKKSQGEIVLGWRISSNGIIEDLRMVNSDLDDQTLIKCVMSHVQTLRFSPPPQRQELLIAHKFTFKKKSLETLAFE